MNSSITLDTKTILEKATLKIHIQYPWNHKIRIYLAGRILRLGAWIAGTKSLIIIDIKDEE